jgi:hypothetical protein
MTLHGELGPTSGRIVVRRGQCCVRTGELSTPPMADAGTLARAATPVRECAIITSPTDSDTVI